MKQSIGFLGFITLLVIAWVSMTGPQATSLTSTLQEVPSLPVVSFLGEGIATHTINPDHIFVIKYRRNDYKELPGPTYTAKENERVWDFSETDSAGVPHYKELVVFGPVEAGCLTEFVQIDDDVDDRINYFYVNGVEVHTVTQGMVTYGSFVVPEDGELTFMANDSVGVAITLCNSQTTPTPTSTATGTATSTSTPTATATETTTVTATPTATSTGTVTITPTDTATATPTETATATPTGSVTPTATNTVTITHTSTPTMTPTMTSTMTSTETPTGTPTVEPPPGPNEGTATVTPPPPPAAPQRLDACLRINFDISGDVARRGTFFVQETTGRVLTTWWADEGWTDSGWITDLMISHPSVHVQVFWVKGDGSEPVEMVIVNPAPGTTYGWLTGGKCHALEVAWPDA